jgi:hypothetical protein
MTDPDEPTGMYELLDAVEAVIKAADPAKSETLAETIDARRKAAYRHPHRRCTLNRRS